jgi:transcriptional regulator with XRE-family HTH domain
MSQVKLDGRAIQIGRSMRGMTQRELAEATQIKPWRLWAIEHDESPARPGELARILKALSTGDATGR